MLRQQLEELLHAHVQCLIVDFSRIEFIDSAGLGILMGADTVEAQGASAGD